MVDDLTHSVAVDALDNLLGGEGTFAGSAPDIDPPGVEDQNPGIDSAQLLTQGIKRKFIVGRDEDGGLRTGRAHRIETWYDSIGITDEADAGANSPPKIVGAGCGGHLRHRAYRCFDKPLDKTTKTVACPLIDPRPGFLLGASAGGGGKWVVDGAVQGFGKGGNVLEFLKRRPKFFWFHPECS